MLLNLVNKSSSNITDSNTSKKKKKCNNIYIVNLENTYDLDINYIDEFVFLNIS